MKKFATYRAASLGDSLMGKHFLQLCRKECPEGKFYLIVPDRGDMVRQLLSAYPWIVVLEVSRRHPVSLLRALVILWKSDVSVTPASLNAFSATTKIFARLVTKRGRLIGFDDGTSLTKKVYDTVIISDKERAVFKNECLAAEAYFREIDCVQPSHQVSKDVTALTEHGLIEGTYVVLHMFSGSDKRGLSLENKKRLISVVQTGLSQSTKIVLTGSTSEVASLQLENESNITLAPVNVYSLQNLIYFSRGVVSVDTGAAHIASGIGKQLVVLCSHGARMWWQRDQHPKTSHILIGKPGSKEGSNRAMTYPDSLNRFDNLEVKELVSMYIR